jgi:intracellular septation protein
LAAPEKIKKTIHLPDAVWTRLSILWIVFFIFSGAANLFVAYTFDTDTWVNFKLFGLMGMTLVFMVLQGLYLAKYMQNDKKEQD